MSASEERLQVVAETIYLVLSRYPAIRQQYEKASLRRIAFESAEEAVAVADATRPKLKVTREMIQSGVNAWQDENGKVDPDLAMVYLWNSVESVLQAALKVTES